MGGDSTTEKYDVVLVATGRRPYTEGLGLENLGIQTDRLGRIQVDSHFRTAVPSIYAVGDCIDDRRSNACPKKVLQQWKLLQDMLDIL